MTADGLLIQLREPCRHCSCETGIIRVRNGQNTVHCSLCDQYAGYNAPKTETGERQRSATTDAEDIRRGITCAVRAQVLARARRRCELCATDLDDVPSWHVEHLIPVEVCVEEEIPKPVANSATNLAAFCEECNLGFKEIVDPLLWLVIMRRRLRGLL